MTRRTTPAEDGAPKANAKAAQPKVTRKTTAIAKTTTPVAVAPPEPLETPLGQRMARPQSFEEAEVRYVAARDAWTAAMRAANSGRSADLASLAIAQETYEAAAAERERWLTGSRVIAVPVEPEKRSGIEAAVGQELAWRRVLHPEPPKGGVLSRVRRRLFGR